jgi:very-short-patch-repair endonuclease
MLCGHRPRVAQWLRLPDHPVTRKECRSAGIVYNNFPWPDVAFLLPPGEGGPKGRMREMCPRKRNCRSPPKHRRLDGFKFRRQHPVSPYVLDFYCDAQRIAVELDGGQHVDGAARDQRRDVFLRTKGIRVLRFWNDAVFKDTGNVLASIWAALHEELPSSGPPDHLLPEGEGKNKHVAAIETAAQAVLDARAAFPGSTLADLYDPVTMPPLRVKAHQALDRAVDAAYIAAEKAARRTPPKLGSDAERVAFLFERYQALTSLLSAEGRRTKRKRATA